MWAICDKNDIPMTIRVLNSDTQQMEDMVWYTNPQAAQNAFSMLTDEQIEQHGAHIKKVELT